MKKSNGIERRGNSYRFRVYADGKSHSRSWKIPNGMTESQARKEAQKRYDEFEKLIRLGISTDRMTFQELSDRFLEDIKETRKPKTVSSYRDNLKKINKYLGAREVKSIIRRDIRDFIKQMEKPYITKSGKEKTLSATTINDYLRTISAVLSYGCQQDILIDNVLIGKGIKKPTVKRDRVKVIPEDTLKLYCDRIMQDDMPLKHKAFFFLVLTTGMRRGEALGLKWSDIDFENSALTINENSQIAEDGSIIFVSPKSSASERYIEINPTVMQMLRKLRTEQKTQRLAMGALWKHDPETPSAEYCEHHNDCASPCRGYCSKHCKMFQPTERVFTQDNGIPMHPKTHYQFLLKLAKKEDFPHVTIHELRHSFVSASIKNGTPLTEIASYVGHASVATTQAVYSHDIREQEKAKSISTDMLEFVSKQA